MDNPTDDRPIGRLTEIGPHIEEAFEPPSAAYRPDTVADMHRAARRIVAAEAGDRQAYGRRGRGTGVFSLDAFIVRRHARAWLNENVSAILRRLGLGELADIERVARLDTAWIDPSATQLLDAARPAEMLAGTPGDVSQAMLAEVTEKVERALAEHGGRLEPGERDAFRLLAPLVRNGWDIRSAADEVAEREDVAYSPETLRKYFRSALSKLPAVA